MKNWLSKNLVAYTLREMFLLFSPAQRRKSIRMIFLTLFIAAMDVFGLASVIPVVYIAANPEKIQTNPYIHSVYTYFGFSSPQIFVLVVFTSLVGLFILKNLLAVRLNYIQLKFSYEISYDLSVRKFNQFYKTDFTEIVSGNSTLYASNIATIPTDLSTGIVVPMQNLLSEMMVVLLMITLISIVDIKLLILLSVILIPSTSFFYRAVRNRSMALGKEKNAERNRMYQYLYQSIHGYVDALLLNKVRFYLDKFFERQKKLNTSYASLALLDNIPNRYIEVVALLGIFIIFIYSLITHTIDQQFLSFLTIFAAAAFRLLPSFNRIIVAIVKIKSSQYVFDIMRDVPYSQAKELLADDGPTEIPSFNKSIRMKEVNYAYKGSNQKALNNISFEVKKGEIVGFIGTSGSGKTTLFNIILRLIQEQSGELLVDDVPLKKNEVSGWRQMIGYVRQDYYLLDASLSQNIAFGKDEHEIDEKKVWECIEKASLSSFVSTLPNGIHTGIGEKGGKLSGGQKQRIAIARALYHNSEIILFDEATSALDNETENEIIETINNLFAQKKTMLMIAHRYTTLKKCDRIYEMKNGEIIKVLQYNDLIRERIQI